MSQILSEKISHVKPGPDAPADALLFALPCPACGQPIAERQESEVGRRGRYHKGCFAFRGAALHARAEDARAGRVAVQRDGPAAAGTVAARPAPAEYRGPPRLYLMRAAVEALGLCDVAHARRREREYERKRLQAAARSGLAADGPEGEGEGPAGEPEATEGGSS